MEAKKGEEQTGRSTSGIWMGPLRDNTTWVKVITAWDYNYMMCKYCFSRRADGQDSNKLACLPVTIPLLPWNILQGDEGDKQIEIDFRPRPYYTWLLNPHEGDYDLTAEFEQENEGPAETQPNASQHGRGR